MINRPIRTCLITLFASIAASIALCLPVLNAPLVSDDWVLLDAVVHKGVWAAWGGGGHEMLGFFRPLVTLSLWLNYKIGGLNPIGYHLFNAIVHGICAWLVGVMAYLFNRNSALTTRQPILIPVLSTLIFLVHPSHCEPVAWVSCRGDLMACMFGLGAMAAWIAKEKATEKNQPTTHVSYLSLALFMLALLAKESIVVLPLILLIFSMTRVTGGFVKRLGWAIRRTWPFFLVLFAFITIRSMVLGHVVGGYGSGRILALHLGSWGRNLIAALSRVWWPALQSRTTAGIAILIVITTSIALLIPNNIDKRQPRFIPFKLFDFAALAFFISLIPIINLPLSIQSSEGERFIYLPSAFASICFAIVLGSFVRQKFKWIFASAILLFYLIGFELALGTWREAGRLAGNLIGDLRRITDSRNIEEIDVYNLPDHLRGAYVFRNGFVEAARLNGITPERIKKIKIKNVQPIRNVNDKFEAPTLTASPGTISVNYSEGKLKEISR